MPLTGVKLNAKQQEELAEAFIIYDMDSDGKVTREQATFVIRSIALSPTNDELNKMFSAGDGPYTLKDLQHIIASKAPPFETVDNLREAFRIFDKDGAGYVDAKEIRHVMVHLGEKLTDDEMDEMIRDVDINGDNQINYDDFVQLIQSCY